MESPRKNLAREAAHSAVLAAAKKLSQYRSCAAAWPHWPGLGEDARWGAGAFYLRFFAGRCTRAVVPCRWPITLSLTSRAQQT